MAGARLLVAAILLAGITAHPAAAAPPRIAVLDFQMINSTILPESAAEQARLAALGEQLRSALEKSGRYRVVSVAPIRAALARDALVPDCNGCEIPLAHQLGADLVAVDYVQKVSDLILNINVIIEDVASGKTVGGGSVDIRGNTDESWRRGLDFLLSDRLHLGD